MLAAIFIIFSPNEKKAPSNDNVKVLDYSELMTLVRTGEVENLTIMGDQARGKTKGGEAFMVNVVISNLFLEQLDKSGVKTKFERPQPAFGISRALDLLGTFLWFAILFMIFRSMKGGGGLGGLGGFMRGNTRVVEPKTTKVMFTDVLGIAEAKKEVSEIVDFLSDPEKYSRIGAKIPKGVLLVGPPGTGKTLLARAIAGEAGVPFLSISGSDFVEMFVGVGASRVRSLFESAKKRAPCLIFIDEIDAVGRQRGGGFGGGNDEREQTLNALLVEMDGFETNEGIIIVAATNRSDVLDDALLRPGRFDRQVHIPLPDIKGREEIVAKYLKQIKIATDVDAEVIARGTPGFSGAELANLVNEAALMAARFNKKVATQKEFDFARDKILMGVERKSLSMTKDEIKMTAYHEAGHAICSVVLPEVDPIHKITIVPRGGALGMVQHLPERDKVSRNITEIKNNIAVAMGGRAAEEIFFGAGKITTGAESDIFQATRLARLSCTRWGLNDKLGHVFYGESMPAYDGQSAKTNVSDETAKLIDLEVKSMVDAGHKLARETIMKNKAAIERLVAALLEHETLGGDEVKLIVSGKEAFKKKHDAGAKKPLVRTSTFAPTVAAPTAEPKSADKKKKGKDAESE
ncbi:MAG: ATP-dependent zinc metalloprotease FtsH [Alphaproteobacteria bacterium]|nr:ATP-dependent zinc metalloprotease FtsH [Alphaproteobacteria bacterium]